MDFKQRVHREIISGAAIYKSEFLDFEYLIYSPEFIHNPYYIISANKDNYEHLTGVHSLISAQDFFVECYNGTIKETDFDFIKGRKSEKSIKGSVREKIKSLPLLAGFFSSKLQAEENFSKGKVHCFLAAADSQITLGFVKAKNVVPSTLLKGQKLDAAKAVDISLILRRDKGADFFDTIVQGEYNAENKNFYLANLHKITKISVDKFIN